MTTINAETAEHAEPIFFCGFRVLCVDVVRTKA